MTVESLLPLFAFVALISVIVLGALLAAIVFKHRDSDQAFMPDPLHLGDTKRSRGSPKWRVAAIVLPIGLFFVILGLSFWLELAERTERHARLTAVALNPPLNDATRTADAIDDAELAAIAATEPKIDLGDDADAYRRQALEAAQKDWDTERIRANDEAYGRDAEAKRIKFLEAALREAGEKQSPKDESKDTDKKRPAWANGDVAENQTVITSGPFTTAESCLADARQQLLLWLPFMKDVAPSEEGADALRELLASQAIDLDQFIKAQHAETRDTSVGEVHLLYTLAEMNPELEAKVEKAISDARVEKTQTDRIGAVTVLGAGVVSLVALAHVVLRSGGRKAPT